MEKNIKRFHGPSKWKHRFLVLININAIDIYWTLFYVWEIISKYTECFIKNLRSLYKIVKDSEKLIIYKVFNITFEQDSKLAWSVIHNTKSGSFWSNLSIFKCFIQKMWRKSFQNFTNFGWFHCRHVK